MEDSRIGRGAFNEGVAIDRGNRGDAHACVVPAAVCPGNRVGELFVCRNSSPIPVEFPCTVVKQHALELNIVLGDEALVVLGKMSGDDHLNGSGGPRRPRNAHPPQPDTVESNEGVIHHHAGGRTRGH